MKNTAAFGTRRAVASTLGAVLLIGSYSQASRAQDDCSTPLAEIDARIAGQPDDYRRQTALAMRQTLELTCEFMSGEARQQLMQGLDDLYPAEDALSEAPAETSIADELAEGLQRLQDLSSANSLQLDSRAPSELTAQQGDVLSSLPVAETLTAQYFERDEAMANLRVWDWDLFEGNLRLLYTTLPVLEQTFLPNWQYYVYVIEAGPDGQVTQRLITSKQAADHEALALRRGHDEFLLIRRQQRVGDYPTTLERWSISEQRMIASTDITGAELEVDGNIYRTARLVAPTSDGHFMFSDSYVSNSSVTSRLAWWKLTIDGETLAADEMIVNRGRIYVQAWLPTHDGGASVVMNMAPDTDVDGLSLENALDDETGFPPTLMPRVGTEKRFYVIDASARLAWESAALERAMTFEFRDAPPENATFEDMQRRIAEQREALNLAERRYVVGRSVNYLNTGPGPLEMVKPMDDGYAALVTHNANRNLRPPIYGQYLVKFNATGVSEEIYLNPLAEQIEAEFTAFEPGPVSGQFYLLASRSSLGAIVLELDEEGQPTAYADSDTDSAGTYLFERATIVGDADGIWLFGYYSPEGYAKPLIWLERFAFP